MLGIEKVDHIGMRVSSKDTSVSFYETLGFVTLADSGFDQGHPIIMQQPSGVVLNLLGPSTSGAGANVLMDREQKYPGITHVSFKVDSLEEAKAFLAASGIELTGSFSFKGMQAVFIRDPDRNVIELDAYAGEEPLTRSEPAESAGEGFGGDPG